MTANQLRYWELRWKQYYEAHYLAETRRSNLAKEAETARHNRAQERIAVQQNVLRRIELSQNQEKINQEWAKISFNDKKLFIETTIENYKLQQKDRELDQKDREIQLQADRLLSDVTMAIADVVTEYTNEQSKRSIERFNAYVNALEAGWTTTGAAKVLQELEEDDKTPQAIKDLIKPLADKYGIEVQLYGPQTVGRKAKDWVSDRIDKSETDKHPLYDDQGNERFDPTHRRYQVEKYGPAYRAAKGYGGKTSLSGGAGYSGGVDSSVVSTAKAEVGPGANIESKNNEGGKSSVIYSPGVSIGVR